MKNVLIAIGSALGIFIIYKILTNKGTGDVTGIEGFTPIVKKQTSTSTGKLMYNPINELAVVKSKNTGSYYITSKLPTAPIKYGSVKEQQEVDYGIVSGYDKNKQPNDTNKFNVFSENNFFYKVLDERTPKTYKTMEDLKKAPVLYVPKENFAISDEDYNKKHQD